MKTRKGVVGKGKTGERRGKAESEFTISDWFQFFEKMWGFFSFSFATVASSSLTPRLAFLLYFYCLCVLCV